jgi:pimeloyl-ACP methyl ester carboxylesterase
MVSKHLLVALVLLFLFVAVCSAESVVDNSSSDAVLPFRIEVSDEQLEDLYRRLREAKLPTALEDVEDWSYGTPLSFVSKMRDYWLTKYQWREREEWMNRVLSQQYMTEINGLKVHFVSAKSENESAVPLILIHGWPGSVLECSKLIPLLTSRFHIICPSIPGYFFSDPPTERGFDTQKVAETFSILMRRLGLRNYLAQGGDWGSEISRWLGIVDPQCIGVHVNFVVTQLPIGLDGIWGFLSSIRTFFQLLFPSLFFTETEIKHLDRLKQYTIQESAYMLHQASFPQSLAFTLSDSPIGLAAYLWDKYYLWSDLKDPSTLIGTYTEDELIDFVMVYWISNSIASSMRLYKETVPKLISQELPYQPKPTAVAAFQDIVVMPRDWSSNLMNIVRWTEFPRGGHFAALEAPELLSRDIVEFSESLREQFINGYIPGKPNLELMAWASYPDEL